MSFRIKTIIGIASIEAILLAILIGNVLGYLRHSNERQLLDRAATTATLFATLSKDAVLSTDLASLEAFVGEVLSNPDLRYARVIDAEGRVLAQQGDPAVLARPFVADHHVESVNDDIFDTGAPISVAGIGYGRVELGFDVRALKELQREARRHSLTIAGVEMGLVALFSFILGLYLTRQLSALKEAAQVVAGGRLGFQLPIVGNDELAETTRAFNRMSLQLQEDAARRDVVMRSALDGIVTADERGEILELNPAAEITFGYRRDELLGRPLAATLLSAGAHPLLAEAMERLRRRQGAEGSGDRFETRGRRADGSEFPLELSLAVAESGGKPLFSAYLRDISARVAAEERLRLSASVFTHAREGIVITDPDGTIVDVNDAFSEITGYSRDEVLGENPRLFKSGRQSKEFYSDLWSNLKGYGHWSGEIWNRRKSGEVYAELITISAVSDEEGATRYYLALFSDITAQKEQQRQLEYIAHYDALTSLPNRVLLGDRLEQAMVHARRRKQRLGVVYLDLDGFKEINDIHGHDVGDELLMQVARRMREVVREGDTVARLGGDEFVAVLNDIKEGPVTEQLLSRLLSAASQPVHLNDAELQVSASLGVTFFPQEEGVDADQLLRQADQAMYQAKLSGKNRYVFFDAEQDRFVRGHYESLERIRQGLEQGEFVLHYQPKVNMRSGELVGAEALIRWQHPERGLLPPSDFMPVVEEHYIAVELGEWVITTALAQAAYWQKMGLDIPVSVNVGALQLQQDDFVERLEAMLQIYPTLTPAHLDLEVLESSALEDIAHVSRLMHDCERIGISFSLDDFGTGYSSLTYLKRLPARYLKIDQSFVRDMLDDPEDLAILEGVLGLTTAFRRLAIAEGVESIEHGELLLQLGCELAQGFGIAAPMPGEALVAWRNTWTPPQSWCSQKRISRDDLPLLFAGVEHRCWIQGLENYLRGKRAAPPILDHHRCRFGQWLDGEGQERYGSHPAFADIERIHREVHALSNQLIELQGRGESERARDGLDELYRLRDGLLQQLKILIDAGEH